MKGFADHQTLTVSFNPQAFVYSPSSIDRIWGIWGSYHNIPYLLKGDYKPWQAFRESAELDDAQDALADEILRAYFGQTSPGLRSPYTPPRVQGPK